MVKHVAGTEGQSHARGSRKYAITL